jgi:uncharacterized protein (DUF736 family)
VSYEQKNGEISIFPNRKKENDKHPDYKGTVMIDGKAWDIALWDKTSKSGLTYMGGKVSEPWKGNDKPSRDNLSQPASTPRPVNDVPFSDDIPF